MFADVFNLLLKKNGKTAIQVARDLSIPKSIVYEWKKGTREPRADKLTMLAVYFGVPVSYLLGDCTEAPARLPETQAEENPDGGRLLVKRENELIFKLHAAREFSEEDYSEIIDNFRRNLDLYLKAKGFNGNQKK